MTNRRQIRFWLITLLVFAFALYVLRDMLLPFRGRHGDRLFSRSGRGPP